MLLLGLNCPSYQARRQYGSRSLGTRSHSRVRKCQCSPSQTLYDSGRSDQGDHAYSKIEYNADGNGQSYSEDLDPPGRRHYLDCADLALRIPDISMLLPWFESLQALERGYIYDDGVPLSIFLQLGDRFP